MSATTAKHDILKVYAAAPLEMCFPEWFEEFCETHLPDLRQYKAGLDHHRHYKNIAIAQPYAADGESLLELLTACHANGLKVRLVGASNYYPGRTFTIAIYRPQDEKQLEEYSFEDKLVGIIEENPNEL